MPRVLPSEVLEIRPSSQAPLPFILTASTLVSTYLGSAGLSEALLTEIEKWWAAHLMAVAGSTQGGALTRKQIGDTSYGYAQGKLGTGLEATLFGQQVLQLYPPLGTLTTMKQASICVD